MEPVVRYEQKIVEAYNMLKQQGIIREDPVVFEPPPPPPPRAKNPIIEDDEKAKVRGVCYVIDYSLMTWEVRMLRLIHFRRVSDYLSELTYCLKRANLRSSVVADLECDLRKCYKAKTCQWCLDFFNSGVQFFQVG